MPESHRQCASGRTGDRECALGGALAAGWPHARPWSRPSSSAQGPALQEGLCRWRPLRVLLGAYWGRFPSPVQISQVTHLQTRPDRVTSRLHALQRRPLAQSKARGTPAPAAQDLPVTLRRARSLLDPSAPARRPPGRSHAAGRFGAACGCPCPAHSARALMGVPRLRQRGLPGVRSQGRGPGLLDECPFLPESL